MAQTTETAPEESRMDIGCLLGLRAAVEDESGPFLYAARHQADVPIKAEGAFSGKTYVTAVSGGESGEFTAPVANPQPVLPTQTTGQFTRATPGPRTFALSAEGRSRTLGKSVLS